jgi:hypothetical protein
MPGIGKWSDPDPQVFRRYWQWGRYMGSHWTRFEIFLNRRLRDPVTSRRQPLGNVPPGTGETDMIAQFYSDTISPPLLSGRGLVFEILPAP